jgi:surfactin synthase thioesterase subunit
LLAVSWPLALAVLVLVPLVWLVVLPFCLVGLCLGAVFAFLRTLLFLPARVLGHRG